MTRNGEVGVVAAYQLLVHVAVATALLALAIYAPLMFKKGLPRWAEIGGVAIGATLAGGVIYALLTGHWPLRG
jgi:hypothetical protein